LIVGTVPSTVSRLTALKSLNIYNNRFAGTVPALPNSLVTTRCTLQADSDTNCMTCPFSQLCRCAATVCQTTTTTLPLRFAPTQPPATPAPIQFPRATLPSTLIETKAPALAEPTKEISANEETTTATTAEETGSTTTAETEAPTLPSTTAETVAVSDPPPATDHMYAIIGGGVAGGLVVVASIAAAWVLISRARKHARSLASTEPISYTYPIDSEPAQQQYQNLPAAAGVQYTNVPDGVPLAPLTPRTSFQTPYTLAPLTPRIALTQGYAPSPLLYGPVPTADP
jgi:hypothetical protein